MFMTALNVALGLDIAAPPAAGRIEGRARALHSAAFLLAAPAAPAGTVFFAALAFASFGKHLPEPLGWLAVIGAIANIGALAGVVSLDGPLNSGNGVVGGIAAPLGLFLAWILSVSVWWLMQEGGARPLSTRDCRTWRAEDEALDPGRLWNLWWRLDRGGNRRRRSAASGSMPGRTSAACKRCGPTVSATSHPSSPKSSSLVGLGLVLEPEKSSYVSPDAPRTSATRSWRDGRFAIRLNSLPPGRSRDRSRNALVCGRVTGRGNTARDDSAASASWDSASRCGQVGALVEFLANPERQDYPLVVMGDMNAEPDSDRIRLLCGHKTAPVRRLHSTLMPGATPRVGRHAWTWDRANPHVRSTMEPCSDRLHPRRPPSRGWAWSRSSIRRISLETCPRSVALGYLGVLAELDAGPLDDGPVPMDQVRLTAG